MTPIILSIIIAGLAVYTQLLRVKLFAAESDYASLMKYDDGLREEIGRLKSTIKLKQNSIEELYDEIETCVRAESVGAGGKC